MKRTLTAVEARKRLGEVLEGVYYRGDEVIIERAGKPMAVVVPVKLYEQQQKARDDAWQYLLEMGNRLNELNKDVPLEVLEAEIDEAVAEVRRARREKEHGPAKAEKSA